MNRDEIKVGDISENLFSLLVNNWMLVTAGNPTQFNPMTASWGGFGHLWNKQVIFLFIRPTRFTYKLMEKNDCCSVTFFDNTYRNILEFCGTKSGFDVDKVKETGLRPFVRDNFVFYEQAYLMMGCKKIYWDDLKCEKFLEDSIENFYPEKDYHRMYVCEIKLILKSTK